jgi:hypothetical protein
VGRGKYLNCGIASERRKYNVKRLAEPDKEVVSRVLQEVGFAERIVGYQVRERSGPMAKSLYSFEGVVDFLNDPFPVLAFEELTRWLRVVMRDEELALKVAEAVAQGHSDYERTQLIRDLMGERLMQCKNAQGNIA